MAAAFEMGATLVEINIRRSSDGHLSCSTTMHWNAARMAGAT